MSDLRILLCVDDTLESRRAALEVASRLWPKGTEVRFLTIVNPADYSIVSLLDEKLAEMHHLHHHLANELEETPVFTSSVVLEGSPVEAILKEANEWMPTTIFIGTRGKGWFGRILTGGVSAAVAAHAHCPVELIGKRVRSGLLNRLVAATLQFSIRRKQT